MSWLARDTDAIVVHVRMPLVRSTPNQALTRRSLMKAPIGL